MTTPDTPTQRPPNTTDPERIRAITHPLRITLLEYLREVNHATATQCATYTGESVASCSFHLRQLAKYGYIERTPGHGREKPWTLTTPTIAVSVDTTTQGSTQAVGALADLAIQRNADLARANLKALLASSSHARWHEYCTAAGASLWLTPDELEEVTTAFFTQLEKFTSRTATDRPADSGRIQFFLTAMLNLASPHEQAASPHGVSDPSSPTADASPSVPEGHQP